MYSGDVNTTMLELLDSGAIKGKEAAFCLLDQRTFECHWATARVLAAHKADPYKIEIFYFLPNAWLARAAAAQRDKAVIERWWGGGDWKEFVRQKSSERVETMIGRFKNDLGYKSVKPWPIYERRGGRRIMYYMIHATDHPEAPRLMARAYNTAVEPKEDYEQLVLQWGLRSDL